MFLERGVVFTHEAVRDWEARFAPLLANTLRAKRTGQAGCSWHVDETYIRVGGMWTYLYRAIDRDGNLVDSMLSEHRDMDVAKRFFTRTLDVAGQPPECVTTDGHDAYPRAIRETLGEDVVHRCNSYLNNRIEQDHRGVQQRYHPGLWGLRRSIPLLSGLRGTTALLPYASGDRQLVPPLSEQRREYCAHWMALMSESLAA
jgi:transposase-like protein